MAVPSGVGRIHRLSGGRARHRESTPACSSRIAKRHRHAGRSRPLAEHVVGSRRAEALAHGHGDMGGAALRHRRRLGRRLRLAPVRPATMDRICDVVPDRSESSRHHHPRRAPSRRARQSRPGPWCRSGDGGRVCRSDLALASAARCTPSRQFGVTARHLSALRKCEPARRRTRGDTETTTRAFHAGDESLVTRLRTHSVVAVDRLLGAIEPETVWLGKSLAGILRWSDSMDASITAARGWPGLWRTTREV